MRWPRTIRRTTRRTAAALVAALALTPVAPVAASPTQSSALSRPLITTGPATLFVSPNHDGHQERARVPFVLDRPAAVVVLVRRRDHLVRDPIRLGRLDAGRQVWTFDGLRPNGRVLPDDSYTVVMRAIRGERRESATVTAVVDTTPDAGTLVTSRATVYPRASVVSDRIEIDYLREGWNANEALYPGQGPYNERWPLRVTIKVIGPVHARIVWRDSVESSGLTFDFEWYGRSQSGEPLPEGTYDVVAGVRDAAGNRSTFARQVSVSHQQLRQQTSSTTGTAASATRYHPEFAPTCQGCGEICSPVPSQRFAGGLSFLACTTGSSHTTAAWFVSSAPVDPSPVDTYRITATGGPTTPGDATSTGSLGNGGTLGPGDDTETTPWLPVRLGIPPYLPDQTRAVFWGFSTSGSSSYDVATFTVEYRSYVPVP